jgi:hypothetical protein
VTAWPPPVSWTKTGPFAAGWPGSQSRDWVRWRKEIREAAEQPCAEGGCTAEHPCATCEARGMVVEGVA